MRTRKKSEEISNLHDIAAVQLKNKDLIKLSAKAKEKSMLILEEFLNFQKAEPSKW